MEQAHRAAAAVEADREARRALIKQVNGSREILRSRCGQKILRPLTGLVMWPLTCDNCRDGGI